MNESKGFISVGIDMQEVRNILSRLDQDKREKALKDALKQTAEKARNRLAKKAQDSYTIKNAGFKKAMKIRSGKNRAVIYAEGEPIPLNKFKISKAGRRVRAQVVKPGHLKELQRGSIKAFVNNIARKGQTRKKDTAKGNAGTAVRHVAVAQRKGKERLVINEKFSNSIPAMLGSEKRVYGLVEPYIAGDLQDNLRKIVDAALGGR